MRTFTNNILGFKNNYCNVEMNVRLDSELRKMKPSLSVLKIRTLRFYFATNTNTDSLLIMAWFRLEDSK